MRVSAGFNHVKKKPAATIHLIHASAAPTAVVIRRGPGEWTHLSLLDTETDTLTPGEWFEGRIFESSCDLSPDGDLFLFKVLPTIKTKRRSKKKIVEPVVDPPMFPELGCGMELRGSWTALSHPPWLRPLVMWPHGNAWDGGGYFTDPRKLTIVARKTILPEPAPPHELDVSFSYDRPHLRSANAGACCRDLDGNLICARGAKIFRQVKWQCGKEIEIADLSGMKPPG